MKHVTFSYVLLALLATFCSANLSQAKQLEDRPIQFPTHDSLMLHGTLSLPMTAGPHPVAILIHGSGPQDRDVTFPVAGPQSTCLFPGLAGDTLRIFRDIADHLQLHGMAVLRYDKRTTPPTVRELKMMEISLFDFEKDVSSAIAWIATQPELDASRVVLIGHSQGTNFLPRLAAQHPDAVQAVIGMATPSVPMDSTIYRQINHIGQLCGDSAQSAQAANQLMGAFQKLRADPKSIVFPIMGAMPTFWLEWLGLVDGTVDDFAKIEVPTLLLQGTEDYNVTLEDARRLEAALPDRGKVIYFEGLNHFFTPKDEPFIPHNVLAAISHWLTDQGLAPGH